VALAPQPITDQITDQNTPYCDELRYTVSNVIKMLAVTQRSGKELNYLPGAPFSPSFLNKFNDTSGLDHLSGPLLGPLGQFLLANVTIRLSIGLEKIS